ncbi:hypothetical protein ABZ896_50705 [Streptomyces sp. NPDC047072]|uniref:hypothetical protein n=1 Tax=Streptomyces sp. NPDC047072 TaxID=3154809 RepID=UPI0033EF67C2
MHITRIRTSSRPSSGEVTPLLAGAATAVAAFGALLALTGSHSPLRAPLVLFFLLAAPAAAIAAALRGLDPYGRLVAAVAGSVALNMLVAQGMLATHRWSARGGVIAVTVISCLLLLAVLVRRRRGAKGRDI